MSFCRTPPQIACTIERRHGTKCGLSSRYPSQREVIPITECTRYTATHLANLKVSRIPLSEKDLIASRVGIFENGTNSMTVCAKHRDPRSARNLLAVSTSLSTSPTQNLQSPGNEIEECHCKCLKRLKTMQWDVLVQIGSGDIYTRLAVVRRNYFKTQV